MTHRPSHSPPYRLSCLIFPTTLKVADWRGPPPQIKEHLINEGCLNFHRFRSCVDEAKERSPLLSNDRSSQTQRKTRRLHQRLVGRRSGRQALRTIGTLADLDELNSQRASVHGFVPSPGNLPKLRARNLACSCIRYPQKHVRRCADVGLGLADTEMAFEPKNALQL